MKYSALLAIVTPHRRTLLLILALLLADSAAALANPWIAGLLTKSILENATGTLPSFQWILLAWFGLLAVKSLLGFASGLLDGFEIVTDPILSLFSFRCAGDDAAQQRLVDALNDDGRLYVTQGLHAGRKVIRFQVGQFATTRADVMMAPGVIAEVWEEIR